MSDESPMLTEAALNAAQRRAAEYPWEMYGIDGVVYAFLAAQDRDALAKVVGEQAWRDAGEPSLTKDEAFTLHVRSRAVVDALLGSGGRAVDAPDDQEPNS